MCITSATLYTKPAMLSVRLANDWQVVLPEYANDKEYASFRDSVTCDLGVLSHGEPSESAEGGTVTYLSPRMITLMEMYGSDLSLYPRGQGNPVEVDEPTGSTAVLSRLLASGSWTALARRTGAMAKATWLNDLQIARCDPNTPMVSTTRCSGPPPDSPSYGRVTSSPAKVPASHWLVHILQAETQADHCVCVTPGGETWIRLGEACWTTPSMIVSRTSVGPERSHSIVLADGTRVRLPDGDPALAELAARATDWLQLGEASVNPAHVACAFDTGGSLRLYRSPAVDPAVDITDDAIRAQTRIRLAL
jgi:hypothetical protein